MSGVTLPTDKEVLDFVADLYQYPSGSAVSWDHVDPGADTAGIYWGAMKLHSGVWVIVPRGSVTPSDFERDAWAVLTDDPDIGFVHDGFFRGVVATLGKIKSIVGDDPWLIAGHSLGAAHTDLLAGKAIKTWRAPLRYVRFGEPRPGLSELVHILSAIPGASYRTVGPDGHDEVTDLPPPLPLPYEHPQNFTDLKVPQQPTTDPWGLFRYHHIQIYQQGLTLEHLG